MMSGQVRIHVIGHQGQQKRSVLQLVAEKMQQYETHCRYFFPSDSCCLSAEDGGQMYSLQNPVLAVPGSLLELISRSQNKEFFLGPLWNFQQYDFMGCKNYNLKGPSSITFSLFC